MWFVSLGHQNKPITLKDIKIPKAAIIRTKRLDFAVILKNWATCFVSCTVYISPFTYVANEICFFFQT
jgi:hypothetical protein